MGHDFNTRGCVGLGALKAAWKISTGNLLQPHGQTLQHLEKKKTQTGSKNHSSRQVLARVAHGAPGMLQSRLLLVLEFPAGSKGKAGAPTLLKWPFSAGKRETGEVTARKAGGGKAGGSSAHGGESSSMELLPRAGTSWGFAPSPPSKHKNMGNVCNRTHEG